MATKKIKKYTTQKKGRSHKLLLHLLRGRTISGTQALANFGIYRLSSVIKNWRDKGFSIETKMITRNGRRYGVYKLIGTPNG